MKIKTILLLLFNHLWQRVNYHIKTQDQIDFSYSSPDCLHFSVKFTINFKLLESLKNIFGKGYSLAALSLWNNMLEAIGGKRWSWHINESLKCPTEKHPYIFTSNNSAMA